MRVVYFLTFIATGFAFAGGFYVGRLQTANDLLNALVNTTKCDYAQDKNYSKFGWRWAIVRYEKP